MLKCEAVASVGAAVCVCFLVWGCSPSPVPQNPLVSSTQPAMAFKTGGAIWASPSIGSDGTIYVGSEDGNLYALDPNGLTMKWAFATGGKITSSPAVSHDGTVYVGSGDKKIYAVKPDGTKKWEYLAGEEAFSNVAIAADETIYVVSGSLTIPVGSITLRGAGIGGAGKLYSFSQDGTRRWEYTSNGWNQASPIVGPDQTVYVRENRKILSFDSGGNKKGEFSFDPNSVMIPVVGGSSPLFVGLWGGQIHVLRSDGAEQISFASPGELLPSPPIGPTGKIYVLFPTEGIYATGLDGGRQILYSTGGVGSDPSAVAGPEAVHFEGASAYYYPEPLVEEPYVADKLYSVIADGTVKWEWYSGDFLTIPVVGSDGTVYVGTYQGYVYAFLK